MTGTRRWATTFAGALALLVGLAPAALAQTRTLNGRVVALDRRSVEGLRLRLIGLGDPVVLRSGEFSAEIPAATTSVSVELRDTALAVVFPVDGRVPVPAGDERVTIVVGEPVTTTVTRALADRQRLSEQLLAEYGVQREAIGGVERGIAAILEKLEVRESELREQMRQRDRQMEVFPVIAQAVEHFVHEARDLHEYFARIGPLVEQSGPQAFEALKQAILDYNDAYETLRTRRAEFETAVERDWPEGSIARRDLADLCDDLEAVHRQHVLPLNELMPPIQAPLLAGRRLDDHGRRALSDLIGRLPPLDRAIAAAEAGALRTLEQLRPR